MSKYVPGTRSDVAMGQAVTLADFKLGAHVYAFAYGYWYRGTVTRISKSRVEVRFVTGSGHVNQRWFHPADGVHIGTATTALLV